MIFLSLDENRFFSLCQRQIPLIEKKPDDTIFLLRNNLEDYSFEGINPEQQCPHVFVHGGSRCGKTEQAIKLATQLPNVDYFDPSGEVWGKHFEKLGLKKHWKRAVLSTTYKAKSKSQVRINASDLHELVLRAFSGTTADLMKIRHALSKFLSLDRKLKTYFNLREIMRKDLGRQKFEMYFQPFHTLLSHNDSAKPIKDYMVGKWLIELEGSRSDFQFPIFVFCLCGWRKNHKLEVKYSRMKLLGMVFDECQDWGKDINPSSRGLVFVATQGAKLGIMAFYLSPVPKINNDIRAQLKAYLIFKTNKECLKSLHEAFGVYMTEDAFDSLEIKDYEDFSCYFFSNGLDIYRNGGRLVLNQPLLLKIDDCFKLFLEEEKNYERLIGVKNSLSNDNLVCLAGLKRF